MIAVTIRTISSPSCKRAFASSEKAGLQSPRSRIQKIDSSYECSVRLLIISAHRGYRTNKLTDNLLVGERFGKFSNKTKGLQNELVYSLVDVVFVVIHSLIRLLDYWIIVFFLIVPILPHPNGANSPKPISPRSTYQVSRP